MKNKTLLFLATAATLAVSANAATIMANAADRQINMTGAGDAGTNATLASSTGTTVQIGRVDSSTNGQFVMPFLLPTLAANEVFANATFTVRVSTANPNSTSSTDLYGLGYRTAATVNASDGFLGTLDITDATLLQDSFFTQGASYANGAIVTTSAGANTALTNYLNTQYAAGAGGNYVFLRLNNEFFHTVGRVEPNTGNVATESQRPTITYDIVTVPEPSTALLGALGALAMLRRRR